MFWGFAPDTTGGSVPVWTPLVTEPTLLSPPKQIPGYASGCAGDQVTVLPRRKYCGAPQLVDKVSYLPIR